MERKLDPWALAASLGVVCVIFVVFIGVAAMFGWSEELVPIISSMYIGFDSTPVGVIIGAVWAFVDGVIAGALIAALYNCFADLTS
ncbi:MAG: bacteriophage holin [Candidatus Aenigmatarchaeota archaeon]